MKPILEFQGDFRWLSNFATVSIAFNGLLFPSVEHAYVASKFKERATHLQIQKLATAGKAKRFGRVNKDNVRKDFDTIKLVHMESFIDEKFDNEPYKSLLLATGNTHIEEGNRWGDTYWGVCNGVGENNLGKLIMEKRAQLIKQQPKAAGGGE
jgi:ribA/ribD-fused uncharacterized protein